jgi:hypothetical protein
VVPVKVPEAALYLIPHDCGGPRILGLTRNHKQPKFKGDAYESRRNDFQNLHDHS